MTLQRKIVSLCFLGVIIYLIVIALESCSTPGSEKNAAETGIKNAPATFIGSSTCQSCHAREFNDWKKSDHFLAMQYPHDSTVLGDFNNTSYSADGVTSKFFKQDGKFYINTEGADGKNHDFEVQYVFGYFPLQQYLIAFPGGRLQSTRLSWNSRDRKWFHQYAGQRIQHRDWLHWTGNSQNWNTMCAYCHSTNLRKNYDYTSDSYDTKWDEINVSCESCHGPGSKHTDFVKSPEYQKGERIENSGLVYARNPAPQQQVNTCAPCHARKSDISQEMKPSAEIMDNMIPNIISDEFYFADGQIKEEDYEYGSFTQSKMFHKEVRCTNCHNPHSGKLLAAGNNLCLSCHQPRYNTKEHHFHEVNTEGAQCISCHMPLKTFMGNDQRRDHSFRIPRPDQSAVFKTPNTCTSCHKGKSDTWAATAIKNWYGPARAYHFSDDLLPGSLLNDNSEKHLLKLLADTQQPEIARATAAHYLASIQTQSSGEALIRALRDKKPLVRYHAIRSLENFHPDTWLQAAYLNLNDNVRAVRIATADLYHRIPPDAIPAAARSAYAAADAENKKFLAYQTDFAVGNVMLADYELQGGDHINAIAHYVRGLKKDSLMNYARLNLAAAYSSVGRNTEALKALKEAAAIDPQSDRAFYNLGLLYYEMNDIPAAAESFEKSVRLGSSNTSVYYNYGLLLQQQGKAKEAEQILKKGFAIDPQATNINYALAFLYINRQQPAKAKVYAENLKRADPDNPDYQGLFRNLGL